MTAFRISKMLAKVGMALALVAAAPLHAEEVDQYGVLNPEELTIDHHKRLLSQGKGVDINTCRLGYPMAKMGDDALARQIFERCAQAGIDGAYPWMSWLDENGKARPDALNRPESNLADAAEWDRRSAARGYSVGQLNHGLNLLRGHGVARDEARGRAMIDAAAAQGDTHARTVIENNYDPYSVLPDPQKPRAF